MDELAQQLAAIRREALNHEADGSSRNAAQAWQRASRLMEQFADRATTREAATRKKRAEEYRRRADDLLAGRITLQPAPSRSTDGSKQQAAGVAGPWLVQDGDTTLTLADVAGLEDVKAQLYQMVLLPMARPELAKAYGVSIGGGLLLYGPPGTGKTYIAKALAGELKAGYFYVSAATLLSKWVGEAEQNVVQLFADARRMSPAVVFVDELEALAGSRDQPDSSGVMRRVLTQLLQEMDGFKGRPEKVLILGATNRPWDIDEAALRPGRFDVALYVPLPDEPARRQILELNLRDRPQAPALDLGALACRLDGWTGADIAGLCARIARNKLQQAAATKNTGEVPPISEGDFDVALSRTRPSVSGDVLEAFEQWRHGKRG